MNIVVKTADQLNTSRKASGFIGDLLNDSELSFQAIEDIEPSPMVKITSRKYSKMSNLSQVMGGMTIMNLSGGGGPVVIETSIVIHGMVMKEEVNPLEENDVKLAFTSTKNLIIGILILLCYVINGAMVGPITVNLPAKNPLVKGLWRTQGNTIISIPIMLALYVWKRKEMNFKRDHSFKMILNSSITSFFDFIWYVSLIVACSMTVTSHAMVMYSSTGVYMMAFILITGGIIHKFEYYGYALFFIGVFLMLTDPYAVKIGGTGNQYLGDLIGFLGAGAGAMLGLYNSRNSKLLHPIVVMTHIFVISGLFQGIFIWFIVGPSTALSMDPGLGIFGWLNDKETIMFIIFVVAPFNGITSNLAFYASYYYWPMEIIAGAILTEPFISQVVAVMFGQDEIPGFRTVFGLTIITIGTLIASYGSRVKAMECIEKFLEEEEQLTSKVSMNLLTNIKKEFAEEDES